MVAVTNYPAALDSHTSGNPYGFAATPNFKSSTLTGAHNNVVTTITVASTVGFPTRGLISIDTEVISYTGTTATTFTGCTRAVDSTAASHADQAEVALVPSSNHHDDLAAAIVALETKLGIGADTAANNELLRGTAAGTTDFGQLRSGDIPNGLITSTHILDGTILDADVNTSAAIAVTKIAIGGALALLRTNAAGNANEWGTGGQIVFPATQAASAGANTLDDYEEGSWTPSLGGTATYGGNNMGSYTKIGNTVFIFMWLSVNVIGTGSTTTVSGLPFTSGFHGCSMPIAAWATLSAARVFLAGFVSAATATIVFSGIGAAAVSLTTPDGILTTSTNINLSGVMRV